MMYILTFRHFIKVLPFAMALLCYSACAKPPYGTAEDDSFTGTIFESTQSRYKREAREAASRQTSLELNERPNIVQHFPPPRIPVGQMDRRGRSRRAAKPTESNDVRHGNIKDEVPPIANDDATRTVESPSVQSSAISSLPDVQRDVVTEDGREVNSEPQAIPIDVAGSSHDMVSAPVAAIEQSDVPSNVKPPGEEPSAMPTLSEAPTPKSEKPTKPQTDFGKSLYSSCINGELKDTMESQVVLKIDAEAIGAALEIHCKCVSQQLEVHADEYTEEFKNLLLYRVAGTLSWGETYRKYSEQPETLVSVMSRSAYIGALANCK